MITVSGGWFILRVHSLFLLLWGLHCTTLQNQATICSHTIQSSLSKKMKTMCLMGFVRRGQEVYQKTLRWYNNCVFLISLLVLSPRWFQSLHIHRGGRRTIDLISWFKGLVKVIVSFNFVPYHLCLLILQGFLSHLSEWNRNIVSSNIYKS